MINRNCTASWSPSRPAAFDVFPVEPSSNANLFQSPLQEIENVILTPHPHVGGSTEEAQERIGEEVTHKLIQYSSVGSILGAVNFPQAHNSPRPDGTCFIQVQRNLSGEHWKSKGVFARNGVNVAAQHYQIDGEIGDMVLDTDDHRDDAEAILRNILELPGSIRAQVLNRPS